MADAALRGRHGGFGLVSDLTSLEVDGRWVAPLVLIVVGGVGLMSTLKAHTAELEER